MSPESACCVMTRFLLLAVLLPGLTAPARAQQPRELTADESVRLGLSQNARTAAAHARAYAAGAALRGSRADRGPTFAARANYTRLSNNIPVLSYRLLGEGSPVTLVPVQLDRYEGEVRFEQSLFSAGGKRHAVAAAVGDAEAAYLRAEQADCDVALDIRRAYWELHRARAVRASLEHALERVDVHLRMVQERVRAGTALRRDLLAAQTRMSEIRLEVLDADNAIETAQLQLNQLIGLSLDTPLALSTTPDSVAIVMPDLDAESERELPSIAALRADVSAAEARLEASESTRWPGFDLAGRFLYAKPNPYFFEEQQYLRHSFEIALTTQWTFWDNGRRSAASGELRAQLGAVRQDLQDARTQAAVTRRSRRLDALHAYRASELAAQTLTEAAETYRVTREQFREGAALATDVLDAEESYRRAEARRAGARADFEIAQAALLQARGRVWP